MTKKYTLDQITDGFCTFLERPDETTTIMIPVSECPEDLKEGDIVEIENIEGKYVIHVLKEETQITRDKVNDLLEKLKNKK